MDVTRRSRHVVSSFTAPSSDTCGENVFHFLGRRIFSHRLPENMFLWAASSCSSLNVSAVKTASDGGVRPPRPDRKLLVYVLCGRRKPTVKKLCEPAELQLHIQTHIFLFCRFYERLRLRAAEAVKLSQGSPGYRHYGMFPPFTWQLLLRSVCVETNKP